MLVEDAMLLLKGWCEDSRRIRVDVTTPDLRIVTTCKIYKIDEPNAHIGFHISGKDYFEFFLIGCDMNFGDAKEDAKEMPIGETAESAILARRPNFKAIIVLLQD